MEKQGPSYLREVQLRFGKKRVKDGSPVGESIEGAQQVVSLFQEMQNETKEKLVIISLDAKYKIIAFEVVATGSLTLVYARHADSLRAPIMVNAYGVIAVHNHPAGDPTPSPADRRFTNRLWDACELLGLKLKDHIIIGDDRYFSFAEKGWLNR